SAPSPLDRHAKEAAFTALAAVLADPRFTRAVVAACRPLVLDLVALIPRCRFPGKRRWTASLSGASEDADAVEVDAAPPTDRFALHLLGGDSPGAAVLLATHRLLAHVPAVRGMHLLHALVNSPAPILRARWFVAHLLAKSSPPLVPHAMRIAPATNRLVERPHFAQWRPLLVAWVNWSAQSPALAPLRVSGDNLAVLLDRMAAAVSPATTTCVIITARRRLEERTDSRDDQFEHKLRCFIDSATRTRRAQATGDRVQCPAPPDGDAGDGPIITREPDEVERVVAEQVQGWFCRYEDGDGGGDPDAQPLLGRWQDAFAPLQRINDNVWNGLMAAPTHKELADVLAASGKDKAPGGTGLTVRLLEQASEKTHTALLALFAACLRTRSAPASWKTGLIYLTASKVLMKILLERLHPVLREHDVLQGARYSAIPGTDTTTPIAILHAAALKARIEDGPLWAYFEDKSKAFDSFVDFYFDGMLHGRTARVLTAYGLSDEVRIKRGFPQGAVESPLLRNLFYVVCEINRLTVETGDADHDEDAHGFGITLEAGSGLRHVGPNREFAAPPFTFRASHRQFDTLRVAAVAYMDDAAFCASDRDHLQRIVDIVDNFNGLTRINANPAKGAVLRMLSKGDGGALTGGPNDPRNAPIVVRGVPVPWAGKSSRYLGVFIDHVMLGREAANTCLALLKDRRITGKAAVYLLNAVFFTAAAYRSLFHVPSLAQLDRIGLSARALVRRKYKLLNTFPTAMLHDRDIIGLHSLADLITQQHVTDLCVVLNDPRPHGVPARYELGILQFQTQCAFSPLERPDLALVPMSSQLPCVWFDNVVLLTRRRKLSIVDRRRDYNLIVAGNCMPTVLVVPEMTVRGKRNQDRVWTKKLIRWLPLYTLETLLEYPPDNDDGLIGRKYTLPMLRRMETKDVQQLVKKFRVSLTEKGNAHMNADDRRVARILLDVANRNHARITDISHGREMYPPAPPMDDDPPAPAGAPPLVYRHTRPRRAAAPVDPGVARAGSAAVFPLPDGYDTATRHDADCRAAANGVTNDDVGHIAAAKLPPGPFSSTRAEIHAFVLAVSQVAAGTALHIYSDSQAAIEAARTQLSPTATMRQRVRCASSDLWSALRLALRDRNVKVTLSWVRGHADDPTTPNNIADRAAKAAANQPPASDAYFSKRTRTESDLHHVPAFFDHEIGGDPRKFMRDLAQAECRDAVLAENVAHLALAQPPPPAPEPAPAADAAAAAVAAANAAAAQAEELDWKATALALHGGSRPLARRTSLDQNKETSFRLRALANKAPCRESLHSVGRIAVPTCGRAECAAEPNPEARCIQCWDAYFKASRCSCGLQDTPFHWLQCKLVDEQRVETLNQISESWLSQLTSVGAAKHDAALNPAAGTLIDALLGPDLLHVMYLDVNTLRADRDAAFATCVAAIPAWAIARRDVEEAGLPIPGEDALPPLLDLPDAAAIRLFSRAITRGAVRACREFLGSPAAAAAAIALHPLPSLHHLEVKGIRGPALRKPTLTWFARGHAAREFITAAVAPACMLHHGLDADDAVMSGFAAVPAELVKEGQAGMAAAMLDSAVLGDAHAALPVLLWAWSMWSQCLVQH
ncbi:hypothetical protein H9P43_008529, partial [Blastocladiella emersonii ATCC 22665]